VVEGHEGVGCGVRSGRVRALSQKIFEWENCVHLVLRAWSCYTNFMAISFMEGRCYAPENLTLLLTLLLAVTITLTLLLTLY